MSQQQFTSKEQSVIALLQNEHLTSTEILNKAKTIPHILTLYSVLDQLRSKGVVDSYMKEGTKYHFAA
jgi:Fe2+ or Zn2+ uptake regulation protein